MCRSWAFTLGHGNVRSREGGEEKFLGRQTEGVQRFQVAYDTSDQDHNLCFRRLFPAIGPVENKTVEHRAFKKV